MDATTPEEQVWERLPDEYKKKLPVKKITYIIDYLFHLINIHYRHENDSSYKKLTLDWAIEYVEEECYQSGLIDDDDDVVAEFVEVVLKTYHKMDPFLVDRNNEFLVFPD